MLGALVLASVSAAASATADANYDGPAALVTLTTPKVALTGVPFDMPFNLSAEVNGTAWPDRVCWEAQRVSDGDASQAFVAGGVRIAAGNLSTTDAKGHRLQYFVAERLTVKQSTLFRMQLVISDCGPGAGARGGGHGGVLAAASVPLHSMPGWLSLTPPGLTIVAAVWLKQVYIALVLGIWLGCLYIARYNPLVAFLRSFDTYFAQVLDFESGHAAVLVFCILLGGLIGIVQRSGGAVGLGKLVTKFTTTKRRGLAAMLALAFGVFFDDYSAILIVGTTFKKIAPSIGISQEKLALIVHGVGTSFSSMTPISSWVGVEVGYIQNQRELRGKDPFVWFMESVPYRTFPITMCLAVVLAATLNADIGPMVAAEQRAMKRIRHLFPSLARHEDEAEGLDPAKEAADSETGLLDADRLGVSLDSLVHGDAPQRQGAGTRPSEGGGGAAEAGDSLDERTVEADMTVNDPLAPLESAPRDRWWNAAVPFLVVAATTFVGMILDGRQACRTAGVPATLINIFTLANSFNALLWGSLFGCLVALVLVIAQRIMTVTTAMEAWTDGIKFNVLEPMITLMFAWAIGAVISDLQAPAFLANALGQSLPAWIIPMLVQLLCFIMSFATGSAFGSMGIMFPLVIPLADQISNHDEDILLQCVGAILGGAVFGNVISPIADDTILSAMSCGAALDAHVRTIVPYAVAAGLASLLLAAIPMGLGLYGAGVAIAVCFAAMVGLFLAFGQQTNGRRTRRLAARIRIRWCGRGDGKQGKGAPAE